MLANEYETKGLCFQYLLISRMMLLDRARSSLDFDGQIQKLAAVLNNSRFQKEATFVGYSVRLRWPWPILTMDVVDIM